MQEPRLRGRGRAWLAVVVLLGMAPRDAAAELPLLSLPSVGMRPPGASVLVGPLATYEQSRPDATGVIVASSGLLPADTSILTGRYASYRAFRAGGAIGLRVLDYLHVQGFDALLGEQDVARGVQLGVTAQRALSGTAGMGGSTLLTFDVYSGAGTANSFAALRLEGDGLAGVGSTQGAGLVGAEHGSSFESGSG